MLSSVLLSPLISMCLLGYVGPGVGLQFFGYVIALLAGVIIAVLLVALYPLRLFLRKRRERMNPEPDTEDGGDDAGVTPRFIDKQE
ncbi:hypothetical protein JXA32_16880 [Candidatus Sumerlaeota bacterium]|nr:hypothetical protein [Candidatus Sumerlaeota bacterium]